MSVIRVDSAEEQYAYLTASFGPPTAWEVLSQTWATLESGEQIEVASLRLATGESVDVRFGAISADDDSFDGSPAQDENPSTTWLDDVMQAATTFSEQNPPHHPGTIARFPVPAAGYADALSVPMALIAVDGASRGLYAPPRIVAVNRHTLEPIGVGEFPGFDPEFWPPERLADWPLPQVRAMPVEQLQGTIQRLSACWSRVITAWFANDSYPWLTEDIAAAMELHARLDTPGMAPYYERMNPVFTKWLQANLVR